MIREYLEEIAQRPSPQGALVKALMVLGATDLGSRDIPNDNEGWGKVNLRETLAPTSGQGIWVDDRSVLSGSGNSKSYTFNITQSNGGFKSVLAWSDERGSTSRRVLGAFSIVLQCWALLPCHGGGHMWPANLR